MPHFKIAHISTFLATLTLSYGEYLLVNHMTVSLAIFPLLNTLFEERAPDSIGILNLGSHYIFIVLFLYGLSFNSYSHSPVLQITLFHLPQIKWESQTSMNN